MHRFNLSRRQLPFGMVILLAAAPALAASPADIMHQAIENQAFNLPVAQMDIVMLLKTKGGKVRERKLNSHTRQVDRLNLTLTRFTAPGEVAGTSFLFLEKKDADDDQHMYLPALKTVRRIAGTEKNAPFMGSDFSYADLESRDLEAASYKQLADATVAGFDCHVIEAIPKNKSAYSRIRTWIRKDDQVFIKAEFMDPRGRLLKQLLVKEIKQVGKRKVPVKTQVSNKQNGHSTLMHIKQIAPNSPLTADDFTVRMLKKR